MNCFGNIFVIRKSSLSLNRRKPAKKHLFLNREITKIRDNFTDINSIKQIEVDGKTILVVSIDSNELYCDDGFVEKEVLKAVSKEIDQIEYDLLLLLTHYSILGTDECPLKNSAVLINFVHKHEIEHVFCGHTHDLELMQTTDLYKRHSFNHFRCGSLSSCNIENDDNMFVYYENLGSDNANLHVVRIFQAQGKLSFKEEIVTF